MRRQEGLYYTCIDYLAKDWQAALTIAANAAGTVPPRETEEEDANEDGSSSSSSEISEFWREKICEWCYQVVDHFDFNREIVSVTMSYLDRYLATRSVNRRIFQLAAMTCLYLAIKLFEPGKIRLSALIDLSRGYFLEEHIVAMEDSVLQALGWHVHPPTPFAFVREFMPLVTHTITNRKRHDISELARFLTELSVCDYWFLARKHSSIALSSILYAMELQGEEVVDPKYKVLFLSKVVAAGLDITYDQEVIHCYERLKEMYVAGGYTPINAPPPAGEFAAAAQPSERIATVSPTSPLEQMEEEANNSSNMTVEKCDHRHWKDKSAEGVNINVIGERKDLGDEDAPLRTCAKVERGKRSCCRLEPRARPTDTWQRPSKRRRDSATNDDDDDKKSLTTLLYVVLKYHTSRCHRDTSIGAAAHQCGIISLSSDGRTIPYARGWAWQHVLLERRLTTNNAIIHNSQYNKDWLLLFEHDPVYTLGRGASEDHLTFLNNGSLNNADKDATLQRLPPIYRIERGGEVTYHGPGQLVLYPLLNLRHSAFKQDLHWYLRNIEEVVIQTLNEFGIDSNRDSINTGVWVGQNKIAAVGVSSSRWITTHGCAINVSPNLDHFDKEIITPCGIEERGVTCINNVLREAGEGKCPSVKEVADVAVKCFGEVFGVDVEEGDPIR
ncbi:lipoate protein ligase [Thalassiosira pseudonana CCMP1335]